MKKLALIIIFVISIISLSTNCKYSQNSGLKSHGTINYTLEVSSNELIKVMAGSNQNDTNLQFVLADISKSNSHSDYIKSFAASWQKHFPNIKLYSIFANVELKDLISPSSTNEEILSVIIDQRNASIDNTIEILKKRVEEFGINTYNISKSSGDFIHVELPLINDSLRLKDILIQTAFVEFWETYKFNNPKIYQSLIIADSISSQISDSLNNDYSIFEYLKPNFVKAEDGNYYPGNGPIMGTAQIKDTAIISSIFRTPEIRKIFPRDMKLFWGFAPPIHLADSEIKYLELYIIHITNRYGNAPLSGNSILKATYNYSDIGKHEILLTFSKTGGYIWKKITKNNISNTIAITIDKKVYAAPIVQSEIIGGKSIISGNFTKEEASDLANLLNNGRLPLSVRIINTEIKMDKNSDTP